MTRFGSANCHEKKPDEARCSRADLSCLGISKELPEGQCYAKYDGVGYVYANNESLSVQSVPIFEGLMDKDDE